MNEEYSQPITEDWLKESGFKWRQFDRQSNKHWVLWLGDSMGMHVSFEDIGIELQHCNWRDEDWWYCWLRSDTAGRYHRFIHVRRLVTRAELIRLIEGLTGQDWNPENNIYGSMRMKEYAQEVRREAERFDKQMLFGSSPWHEIEKDDTRGRALPEHYEEHENRNRKR